MRIFFNTVADAQSFCDKTHAALIAEDAPYAKSVAAGQTVRWDSPRFDLDANGKPTGQPYVIVKDRCAPTLTPAESSAVVSDVGPVVIGPSESAGTI